MQQQDTGEYSHAQAGTLQLDGISFIKMYMCTYSLVLSAFKYAPLQACERDQCMQLTIAIKKQK